MNTMQNPTKLRDLLRTDLWGYNTISDIFQPGGWALQSPLSEFFGSSEKESFDRTYEKNGSFIIEIVRPFASKEDFKVEWCETDRTLKVKFAKETTEENTNGSTLQMATAFEREFTIMNARQDSKIQTKFEGSTLTISVPIDPNTPDVAKGFTKIEIQ